MIRTADNTKGRILQAAYELFYRKGFARVGVDMIAEKAGVTKRTLYYHFKSKDHLLGDVFHFGQELALERIQRWGSGLADELDPMLDSLSFQLADSAAKPRWAGAGFTRIVMELADLPGHPARAVASRHKTAMETWLATEFARRKVASPDQRARQVVLLLEGCTSLMLIHGDRRYAQAAAEAAKSLVSVGRKSRFRSLSQCDSTVDRITSGNAKINREPRPLVQAAFGQYFLEARRAPSAIALSLA